MPFPNGDLTTAERNAYEPPPCPDCGSTNVRVNWQDVGGMSDATGTRWSPGTMSCRDCRNMQR